MEKTDILQKLGLSPNEISVYLSLLNHGPGTVMTIAKNTGIHRPTIYKIIPALEERGLITKFPKGKRVNYVAESPEKLETLLEGVTTKLKEILPELKATHDSQGKRPIIKFLEGKNGIRFVLEDLVTSLKHGDIYYRYSAVDDIKKLDNYLPENYRRIRDSKKLERFVITNEKIKKAKKEKLERAIRLVPERYGLFDYNINQIIYGKKVAFIDYNTETALIIENPTIAEFQKKIFKILYDHLE